MIALIPINESKCNFVLKEYQAKFFTNNELIQIILRL